MKTLSRRHFFKTSAATAATAAVPFRAPAPATPFEAAAGLCLILAVGAAAVVCVVRLCRPKYILYFGIDENKTSNAGRNYVCLACSRAEAEQRELTRCQGPLDLGTCQTRAAIANTNYQAIACGPIATTPTVHASVTLETTHTPNDPKSWRPAAPAKMMDITDGEDPSVTFTLPLEDGPTFYRASATAV